MQTVVARELAAMPRAQLWEWARATSAQTPVRVQFDDGVVESTVGQTVYSAYCWGLYNTYPKTPALKHHHLNGGKIRDSSHTELMNRVLWDCYEVYGNRIKLERLSKLIYEMTNELYNDFTAECGEYVQTMHLFDFIDIAGHPKIQEVIAKTPPSAFNIASKIYPRATEVLSSEEELPGNNITRAVHNGLLSLGQVLQCTVVRGAAADVDSRIFPRPIMSNFTIGLRSLHDSLTESRSATKALSHNEEHLRKVEYFNRKVQLMAGNIMRLYRTDCKSRTYMPWHVHSRDLSKLEGVYYWDEGAKELRVIRASDKHLEGNIIQIRSPIFCNLKDRQGVCATCLGEIALSIPDGTNPGDFAARTMSEESAQTVLSTKHLDGNAASSRLDISTFEEDYIQEGARDNTIVLAPRLKKYEVKLIVKADEAPGFGMVDLKSGVRIELLQTSQFSELSEVMFVIVRGKETERTQISVSSGSLRSSLSHEMLAYIRDHDWELDERNNFVIDLKDWDYAQPAFVVPARAENMLDIIKSIETFLRASNSSATTVRRGSPRAGTEDAGRNRTLRTITDVPTALREFYELVTAHMKMNVPHLSLLLRAVMVSSTADRDYRLPLLGNKIEFGSFDTTMERRSAALAMAYERHHQMLTTPTSYLIKNRHDSVYDPLLR